MFRIVEMRSIYPAFIVIFLILCLAACEGGQKQGDDDHLVHSINNTDTGSKSKDFNQGDIVVGKRIFELNCKICHGSDGTLGLNGAKDLTVSPLTLDEMVFVITKGRNTMTPFENVLSEQEILDAAHYVKSLKQ